MDLIREINEKYSILEAEVDKKLENVRVQEEKLDKLHRAFDANNNTNNVAEKILSYEEAIQRNANLLKTLEMAKARLRSRSTYSPVEQILQKALENYKRDLDTPRSRANQRDNKTTRSNVSHVAKANESK